MINSFLKKASKNVIEIFFICLLSAWMYVPSFSKLTLFDLIPFSLILMLLILIIWEVRVLGKAIGILFLLGGILFIFPVVFEYLEFPLGDKEGLKLLLVGSLISISMIVMSVRLIFKYSLRKE